MNTKHLGRVFERYIERFAELNEKPEPDESYKWAAVKNFQKVLNLDAPDTEFAEMLWNAKKATENLIDSSMQPFGALCEYAEREPQTVREMLRDLFAEDGGDLAVRQEKIDIFLRRADELKEKYFPRSYMFVNTQQSAMAYLWFYDPDRHYYYKATEAKYLADCVEFYDDWGTNRAFRLDVFHRFCDELIAQMKSFPALIKTHKSRFEDSDREMHRDEKLHILAVDIIFCAKRYNLYDGIPIKDSSAPARRLYQERKRKAAELKAVLDAAKNNADLLEEAKTSFGDMLRSGADITHRLYGAARFVSLSDGKCTLLFENGAEKKFDFLFSLVGGQLKIADPEFAPLLEKYRPVMKTEKSIAMQEALAMKALEPYRDYLD